MARMVRIEIVYDMDDERKTLEAERQDWLNGHVNVQDIVNCSSDLAVTIVPIPEDEQ